VVDHSTKAFTAQPGFAWRLAEGLFIGPGELARRGEARGERHVEDREGGLAQELARPLKSQPAVMRVDAMADMAAEQPFELPKRDPALVRQGLARLRHVNACFHGAKHCKQLLVGNAEPVA